VLAVAVAAWFSAGWASIAVGAGAIAPNFEATNPRHAVRLEGSLIALVSQVAFMVLSGVGIALPLVARVLPLGLGVLAVVAGPLLTGARLGWWSWCSRLGRARCAGPALFVCDFCLGLALGLVGSWPVELASIPLT
jgi:hypothetical protein